MNWRKFKSKYKHGDTMTKFNFESGFSEVSACRQCFQIYCKALFLCVHFKHRTSWVSVVEEIYTCLGILFSGRHHHLGCYLLAQTLYIATSWVLSSCGLIWLEHFREAKKIEHSPLFQLWKQKTCTHKRVAIFFCFIDEISSELFGGKCTPVIFSKCSFSVTTLSSHSTILLL